MGRPTVTIGVGGTLYQYHPHFHALLEGKLADISDSGVQVSIVPSTNSLSPLHILNCSSYLSVEIGPGRRRELSWRCYDGGRDREVEDHLSVLYCCSLGLGRVGFSSSSSLCCKSGPSVLRPSCATERKDGRSAAPGTFAHHPCICV